MSGVVPERVLPKLPIRDGDAFETRVTGRGSRVRFCRNLATGETGSWARGGESVEGADGGEGRFSDTEFVLEDAPYVLKTDGEADFLVATEVNRDGRHWIVCARHATAADVVAARRRLG